MTATTHVRWMIRRDLSAVAEVEAATGGGWSDDDYLDHLRARNCIGLVAAVGDDVVGVLVYELVAHRSSGDVVYKPGNTLRLLRLRAVDAAAEAALLEKLAYKLVSHRRRFLDCGRWSREWQSGTVAALLGNRDTPPPILADALEDAGCDCGPLLWLLRSESVEVAAAVPAVLRQLRRGWKR